MRIVVNTYNYVYRKLTAIIALLAFPILFATPVKNETAVFLQQQIESITSHSSRDAVEIFKIASSAQKPNLLIRGKVRLKAFFKTFTPSSGFKIQGHAIRVGLQHIIRELQPQKPEYYSFLFRFTPF